MQGYIPGHFVRRSGQKPITKTQGFSALTIYNYSKPTQLVNKEQPPAASDNFKFFSFAAAQAEEENHAPDRPIHTHCPGDTHNAEIQQDSENPGKYQPEGNRCENRYHHGIFDISGST
jgi:hypothetical protein